MRSWLTDRVVSFLARQKRVSSFKKGVGILEATLAKNEEFCFQKVLSYSKSPLWVARYLAARKLPLFLCRDEVGLENLLKELAEDENPLVREGVAWGLAHLLENRFQEGLLRCERWSRDPSEAVRRAAMMATVPSIKGPEELRAEVLLGFLEIFVGDPSPAVRQEWVRLVVGQALLEAHPQLTFRWLERWLTRGDVFLDRQVSYLLLVSPLIDRHPREALQLVRELADRPDLSPVIRTRVNLILRRLQKNIAESSKLKVQADILRAG